MSSFPAIANFGFELDDSNFITFFFTKRGGYYLCSCDDWPAFDYFITITNKQHPVKLDSAALSSLQAVYFDYLPGNYLVLSSAS